MPGVVFPLAEGVHYHVTKVSEIVASSQAATENATVVTSLLEELRERGVRTDVPTLSLLGGAKALRAAVKSV